MNFKGDPTIIVTIEDMVEDYTFDCVWTAQTFSGFNYLWDTVTISGLDAWNGTHALAINASKLKGCINYLLGTIASSDLLQEVTVDTHRRYLSGPTGCTVVSDEYVSHDYAAQLRINPPAASGTHPVELDWWNEVVFDGFASYTTCYITSTQRLICSNSYDPLLDTGNVNELFRPREVPGILPRPLAATQDIFILHTASPSGRCVSPYSPSYVPIGKMIAEMIDDV